MVVTAIQISDVASTAFGNNMERVLNILFESNYLSYFRRTLIWLTYIKKWRLSCYSRIGCYEELLFLQSSSLK